MSLNETRGQAIIERFWSMVARAGPNDCWIWQGEYNKFGRPMYCICFDGKRVRMIAS